MDSGSCTMRRRLLRRPSSARVATSLRVHSQTIHDVQRGKPVEDAQQVIANHLNQSCIGLECGTSCMGCEDYIVELPQGRVRRQWLRLIDVQTGTTKMARKQCLDERLLVDDRAARRVDEDRAWLHLRESGAVD